MTTIGFVCTNYNNAAFTEEAVASLFGPGGRSGLHVAIVDNKSHSDDAARLSKLEERYPNVHVVLNKENVGYFRGLNIGIELLRRALPTVDVLVVGNNDLVFPDDFVERVRQYREVFEEWAVVTPDLVTFEGVHQNPHVRLPISRARKLIWDLYFSSYAAARLIKLGAIVSRRFTARRENAGNSTLYQFGGPIEQGYGACYLLGPVFFRYFTRLCAPTFMMQEEFFLSEQLKLIGQEMYYDPRIVVHHHGHAATRSMPGKRHWLMSRDAHVVYKEYRNMPAADHARFFTNCRREAL
jgi:GT2 family glycosyltransferase